MMSQYLHDKKNQSTQLKLTQKQTKEGINMETQNQLLNRPQNLSHQNNPQQKKNLDPLRNSKILVHIIKQGLHKLLHQFRSNNYDVNFVIRQVRTYLHEEPQSQQKTEIMKIWEELQVFLWQLSIAPKFWIVMLENQTIFSENAQTIDLHLFTSKIYRRVSQQLKKACPIASSLFLQIASDQVYFLLEQINLQICDIYHKGKLIIEKEIEQVTEIIKQSKIINFYILFKILLDISANCYEKIERFLQDGMFGHVDPSYSQIFTHYIIEKHDVLSMKSSVNEEEKSENRLSVSQKQDLIISKIKTSNNVKWREAIREDGQIGIMVEIQREDIEGQGTQALQKSKKGNNEQYIVKLDQNGQIDVMSCNSVRLNWKVCQQKSQRNSILSLIQNKKKLASKLRNVPTQLKTLTMLNNVSAVGGSLGKCIADINNYDSASDFMMDLSKGAAISGTFNYLIYNVPLIGYLFVTGGYTYTFYSIFSNKYSTFGKKFEEIGNLTIDTASSLGSGILGAFVGQSLIPVPFLGAFIGGVVGGLVGQLGGKALSTYLQNSRFDKTIVGLKNTIKPAGYWEANSQTLQILNIKYEKFYATIPQQLQKRMNCDRIWLTLICFTLYSFYESKNRKKFMDKSMEKLKKQREALESFDISMEEYQAQYEYVPTLDMQCITKFLTNEKVEYVSCIKELEEFMGLMFSRIK